MQGGLTPAEAVAAYAAIAEARADELRAEAEGSGATTRPAAAARARARAAALEAEAATWRLLGWLHGDADPAIPCGTGGPATCAVPTGRQAVAAAVAADPGLNRLARLVAWLEGLAGRALDREEDADGLLFAAGEALPRASRGRAGRAAAVEAASPPGGGGASASSTATALAELDPDAASRAWAAHTGGPGAPPPPTWAPADAEADARLLRRLWRLVRAGRVSQARALAVRAGAPWRAALLGDGAGTAGLTLVGPAAAEADALAARAAARGGGSGAADPTIAAAAAEADAGGCGALRALWRVTAAAAAASASASADGGGVPSPSLSTLPSGPAAEAALFGVLGGDARAALGATRGWHDALWALARCALEAGADEATGASGVGSPTAPAAPAAAWPPPELAGRVPANPADLLAGAGRAADGVGDAAGCAAFLSPAAGSGRVDPALVEAAAGHRAAAEALILGGPALAAWLRAALPAWAAAEEEGGEPAPSSRRGRRPAASARFAAHFALALADLGLAPEPHASTSDAPAAARALAAAADRAVSWYCLSLLDAGLGALAPPLAARASAPTRAGVLGVRLSLLATAPAGEAAAALAEAAAWVDGWAAAGRGDAAPGEAGALAAAAAERARAGDSGGPAARAIAARWLWLSPDTLPAAAAHANRVLRELACAGGAGAADAARALFASIPAEPAAAVDAASPGAPPGAAAALAGAGIPPDAAAALREVGAWRAWFGADAAWRAWSAAYGAVSAARPAAPSPAQVSELRDKAAAAVEAALALAADPGALFACVGGGGGAGEGLLGVEPGGGDGDDVTTACLALTLDVGAATAAAAVPPPARRPKPPGGVDDGAGGGAAYTPVAAGDAAAAAAALGRSLEAAIAAAPDAARPAFLEASAAPGEGPDSGFVWVLLRASGGGGELCVSAVAALGAATLKGALPHAPPRGAAVSVRASDPRTASALIQATLLPRLLLRAASAREAALSLGAHPATGAAALALAASYPASACLSRGEVQTLLERERRAAICALAAGEERGGA